jgi:hypothetical protein
LTYFVRLAILFRTVIASNAPAALQAQALPSTSMHQPSGLAFVMLAAMERMEIFASLVPKSLR